MSGVESIKYSEGTLRKNYAIIVAGGSGSRMNSALPKQFLLLKGLPVLMHTINAFYRSAIHPEIILVLHQDYHIYWQQLLKDYHFKIPHSVIEGGSERFGSVKNALPYVSDNSLVAIHDAVRPIVPEEVILRCFALANEKGAAIPTVGSRDSLRKKSGSETIAIDREEILIVQTPQVFRSEILKKAYEQPYSSDFTDDASVVEKSGVRIAITEGDNRNIKITYPEDLDVASLFLQENINKNKKSGSRRI